MADTLCTMAEKGDEAMRRFLETPRTNEVEEMWQLRPLAMQMERELAYARKALAKNGDVIALRDLDNMRRAWEEEKP
jgi:hypothetical protein